MAKLDFHGFKFAQDAVPYKDVVMGKEVSTNYDTYVEGSTIQKITSTSNVYLFNSKVEEVTAKNVYVGDTCSVKNVNTTGKVWVELSKKNAEKPVFSKLHAAGGLQLLILDPDLQLNFKNMTFAKRVNLEEDPSSSYVFENGKIVGDIVSKTEGAKNEVTLQGSTVFTGKMIGSATLIDERTKKE